MKFPKDNILDNWLAENKNPEIDNYIEKNLALTEKILAILKEKKIKKVEFAKMLGKKPSEISKWLTGMHNLTLKSITKMETVLEVDLINIQPKVEYKYVYLGSIKSDDILAEKDTDQYEESDYSYAM